MMFGWAHRWPLHLADGGDDVEGVFRQAVMTEQLEWDLSAIVIDAQSATDVHGVTGNADHPQLTVKARTFPEAALNIADVAVCEPK